MIPKRKLIYCVINYFFFFIPTFSSTVTLFFIFRGRLTPKVPFDIFPLLDFLSPLPINDIFSFITVPVQNSFRYNRISLFRFFYKLRKHNPKSKVFANIKSFRIA